MHTARVFVHAVAEARRTGFGFSGKLANAHQPVLALVSLCFAHRLRVTQTDTGGAGACVWQPRGRERRRRPH